MKLNKSLLALMAALALGNSAAHAADGTITFNGVVTASACTAIASVTANSVYTGTPITATLTLPNVTATTLNAAAGTYAGQTPFSIQLTNCEATTALNNVRAVFTSSSSPVGDAYVMANVATTMPATDVAVAIMQPNGTTQIDLNGGPATDPGLALPPIGTPGPLTLNYKAAYKSLSTGVTAGNVQGVADFIISYF